MTKAQIATAKELLTAAGFTLSIDGCGCCGSPRVYLEHNGVAIIHEDGRTRNEAIFDTRKSAEEEEQ